MSLKSIKFKIQISYLSIRKNKSISNKTFQFLFSEMFCYWNVYLLLIYCSMNGHVRRRSYKTFDNTVQFQLAGYTSDTPALKIGNEGEQTLLVHEDVLPLI